MADESGEAASVGTPDNSEETNRVTEPPYGLIDGDCIVAYRGNTPVTVILIQELRMPGQPPLYRLKQEYPELLDIMFRLTNHWFVDEVSAKAYAEKWLTRRFGA